MDLEQFFSKLQLFDGEEKDNSELSEDFMQFDTLEDGIAHQLQKRTALKTELEAVELKITKVKKELRISEKQDEKMRKNLSEQNEELKGFKEIYATIQNAYLTLKNSEQIIKMNLQDLEIKLQQENDKTANLKQVNYYKKELDEIVKKYTDEIDQRNKNKSDLDKKQLVLSETKNELLKAEIEYKKVLQRATENKKEQPEDYKKCVIEIAQVYVDMMKHNANITEEREMVKELDDQQFSLQSNSINTQPLTQGTELAEELNDLQLSLQSNATNTQFLTQETAMSEEFGDLMINSQMDPPETKSIRITETKKQAKIDQVDQAEEYFDFSSLIENKTNENPTNDFLQSNFNHYFNFNVTSDNKPASKQEDSDFNVTSDNKPASKQENSDFFFNF